MAVDDAEEDAGLDDEDFEDDELEPTPDDEFDCMASFGFCKSCKNRFCISSNSCK